METCTGLELTLKPGAVQDVPQLARLLLTVLVEDSLRLRLASAARAAALQYAPSVIADRCGSSPTASGSAFGSLCHLEAAVAADLGHGLCKPAWCERVLTPPLAVAFQPAAAYPQLGGGCAHHCGITVFSLTACLQSSKLKQFTRLRVVQAGGGAVQPDGGRAGAAAPAHARAGRPAPRLRGRLAGLR